MTLTHGAILSYIHFTIGYQIYKVRPDRSQLTLLSTDNSVVHDSGKWSPDGSKYWNDRNDRLYIEDSNGVLINQILGQNGGLFFD